MTSTFPADKKHTIGEIVSIFETGRISSPSAYQTCTILRDGAGISYGKHQATDKAGSLDRIILSYIDAKGKFADQLKPCLGLIDQNVSAHNPSDPKVKALVELLKQAGADPVMQASQDAVFDEGYWNPAVSQGLSMGLMFPLSYGVVYDTCIHSGPGGVAKIRAKFSEVPPVRGGDEKEFITAYVKARRAWLASNPNPVVQATVYRMDAFLDVIKKGNWHLDLPMTVRGQTIKA